jgi:ribosomal protein S10
MDGRCWNKVLTSPPAPLQKRGEFESRINKRIIKIDNKAINGKEKILKLKYN